ncbi:hypothetical protein D3C79_976040 [compost metagenome]
MPHVGETGEKTLIDRGEFEAAQGQRGHALEAYRLGQCRQCAQACPVQYQRKIAVRIANAPLPGMANAPGNARASDQLDGPGGLPTPRP